MLMFPGMFFCHLKVSALVLKSEVLFSSSSLIFFFNFFFTSINLSNDFLSHCNC